MTQGLAHKLPEDGEVYGEVPGTGETAAPPQAPPPPDPGAALIRTGDKVAFGLVLLAGTAFYTSLIAWLL